MILCTSCGCKLPDGTECCPRCGALLNAAENLNDTGPAQNQARPAGNANGNAARNAAYGAGAAMGAAGQNRKDPRQNNGQNYNPYAAGYSQGAADQNYNAGYTQGQADQNYAAGYAQGKADQDYAAGYAQGQADQNYAAGYARGQADQNYAAGYAQGAAGQTYGAGYSQQPVYAQQRNGNPRQGAGYSQQPVYAQQRNGDSRQRDSLAYDSDNASGRGATRQNYAARTYEEEVGLDEEKPRNNKRKLAIIGVIVGVLLVAAIVVIFLMINRGGSSEKNAQPSASPSASVSPSAAAALTPEEALAKVAATYNCYAQLSENDSTGYTFQCYNSYDQATGAYSDQIGSVRVDAKTGEITVLSGMTGVSPTATPTPTATATPTPTPTKDSRIIGAGTAPSTYLNVYYVTAKTYLSLRSSNSQSGSELGRMNYATKVYVLDMSGDFWYVYSASLGMYGYCSNGYLSATEPVVVTATPTPTPTTEPTPEPDTGVPDVSPIEPLPEPGDGTEPVDTPYYIRHASVTSGALAVRNAAASDDSNIIGYAQNGEEVWIVDTTRDSQFWYVWVPSIHMYGYANKDYIK